jgi:hypothetical protein
MPTQSTHLEEIIRRHNNTATLKVVFLDIVKYSKRRSVNQVAVIELFTTILRQAMQEVAKQNVDYAQDNGINFKDDVIALPTGDGAAIIFSFEGIHDIHLFFSLAVLKAIYEHNQKNACARFKEQGWCNCHPNFEVRVGISEGKGIVYKDVNGAYNIAGHVINLAARVMGKMDGGQIAFTEEAYKQLIDMVDDPNLSDNFREFAEIKIKHDEEISLYQFLGGDLDFVNSLPPEDLGMRDRMGKVIEKLEKTGFVSPLAPMLGLSPEKMLSLMEAFSSIMSDETIDLDEHDKRTK